jgi:hypothetical protein
VQYGQALHGSAGRLKVLRFEPDSPWVVGQYVMFTDNKTGRSALKVVESVEKSPDDNEVQYHFVSEPIWRIRQQGVRPYAELD